MFTLDYALWFDLVLPGLERLGMPIPLGGTSNHFRTDVLRELHAWDPFNVTEDADLGIRIGAEGLSRRRRRFDHVRGGELPRRPMAPPALALDQGLHADLAGAHAPAAALAPQRRRCSVFSASSSSSAARCWPACSIRCSGCSIWSGSPPRAANLDPLFPQFCCSSCLFNLLAGNGAFIYPDHARADPARLARSHSL